MVDTVQYSDHFVELHLLGHNRQPVVVLVVEVQALRAVDLYKILLFSFPKTVDNH